MTDKGPLIGRGRAAEVFAWKGNLVVKLLLPGGLTAHAEHEASVTQAAHNAGLPVPAVEGVVEVDGRPGIIFERVDGPSMLEEVTSRPWKVWHLARTLADLHVRMHACKLPDLPSLKAELEEWFRSDERLPAPIREASQKALELLPEGDVLCHGDFHPDNITMTARGPVIIDWPLAHRGDRHADIAHTSFLLRRSSPIPGAARQWLIRVGRTLFQSAYMTRYLHLQPVSPALIAGWQLPLAAWRLAADIPGEREQLLAIIRERLQSFM